MEKADWSGSFSHVSSFGFLLVLFISATEKNCCLGCLIGSGDILLVKTDRNSHAFLSLPPMGRSCPFFPAT
jgi:hypothetical protein